MGFDYEIKNQEKERFCAHLRRIKGRLLGIEMEQKGMEQKKGRITRSLVADGWEP
jgi:DNA-binding FrmR family transcriptional regulator